MRHVRITLFTVILTIVTTNAGLSQVTRSYHVKFDNKQYRVTEETIVKDTTGEELTFGKWTDLLSTGQYRLVPLTLKNGVPDEVLIKPLSKKDKERIKQEMMEMQTSMTRKQFTEGESFYNFELTDINGNEWKLSDLQNKVVVLNFWFTRCAPCLKEIPKLNKLVADFKDKNVVFLALSNTDSKEEIQSFLEDKPFRYQLIANEQSLPIINHYKIFLYPTHLVLNGMGEVAYASSGYTESTVMI